MLKTKRFLSSAEHKDPRARPVGWRLAELEDTTEPGALWHGWEKPDGTHEIACLVTMSPEKAAAAATEASALQAIEARHAANATRLEALRRRARRYARDPVANVNAKLTDIEIHEFIALSGGTLSQE